MLLFRSFYPHTQVKWFKVNFSPIFLWASSFQSPGTDFYAYPPPPPLRGGKERGGFTPVTGS